MYNEIQESSREVYRRGKWPMSEYQGDNQDNDFSSEVHLLVGKLVPIVAIHSLGGSRANWHHTPNPQ